MDSKLVFMICFLSFGLVKAEGPLFQHKDTYDQQEFDNVYQDLRKVRLFSMFGTLNCIDLPTFCIDMVAHQVILATGTVSAPILTLGGSSDTGLYLPIASRRISFSIGGSENFRIDKTDGIEWLNGQLTGPNGTISNPAYGWNNDSASGRYLKDQGFMADVINGTEMVVYASTGVAVKGTTTNNNARPGDIGESTSTSKTTITNIATTNVWQNYDSVALNSGDWVCGGGMGFVQNGATITQVKAVISVNSGNTTTDHLFGDNQQDGPPPTANSNQSVQIVAYHLLLGSQTTVYLKGLASFSAGTPQFSGRITCVRPR